jgi:hypothetical protein
MKPRQKKNGIKPIYVCSFFYAWPQAHQFAPRILFRQSNVSAM